MSLEKDFRQLLRFQSDTYDVKKDINNSRFSKEKCVEKTRFTMNIFHNHKRDQLLWFKRGKTNPKKRERTPIKSVLKFSGQYNNDSLKDKISPRTQSN